MSQGNGNMNTPAVVEAENNYKSEIDSKEYTYDDAVECTGNGPYNYGLLAVCSVICNAVAVDMFGFGLIVAASSCDLNLNNQQKGIIASMPFAGILFSYPWGYFADTRGRKKAIIWSTSVGFFFAALSSFSWTWYTLAIFKFIGYSFSTSAFSLAFTLLGECTDTQHRGQYLQVMNSVNLASEAVSFLFAKAILPLEFSYQIPWLNINYRPWRLLTIIMAAPLALGAVMLTFFYESPKFLANIGEAEKSVKILNDIYERNGGKKGEYPVKKIESNIERSTQRSKESIWVSLWVQTAPIFKPPYLWRTLQLYYLLCIICSTNNVFVMWFPTMVNSFFLSFDDGSSGKKSFCDRIVVNSSSLSNISLDENYNCNDTISDSTTWAGIIYGLFYVILNLLVSRLASKKRLVLVTILLVCGICGVMVNLILEPIVSMLMYVLLQGTSIGIGIAASYFVDLYPTSYRAMVSSLGFMVARGSTFVGFNVLGAVFNNYCEITFYLWSVYVFSGVLVSYFLPLDIRKS